MSNFKCDKCGMTNVDCGAGVYKTPRELELENIISEIKKVCIENTWIFADGTAIRSDSLDDILNIIKSAKDGE